MAALLAKYRITDATPRTGQLRATRKFLSSQLDYHVNTRSRDTAQGGEASKAKRISNRTAAIRDVAGAIQASLVAIERKAHATPILPGAVDRIRHRMETLAPRRGITVGMLIKLISLEESDFSGGEAAVYEALGVQPAELPTAIPVRRRPDGQSPSPPLKAPRSPEPVTPAPARSESADDDVAMPTTIHRDGKQGVHTTPSSERAVSFHPAPALQPPPPPVAAASAPPTAPAAERPAEVADRQAQAVQHFQDRYPVFREGRPLYALRMLMLQIDSEPAYRPLLVPRAEGTTRQSYDDRVTHAVNYIRSRASNTEIGLPELTRHAMTERIGPPALDIGDPAGRARPRRATNRIGH